MKCLRFEKIGNRDFINIENCSEKSLFKDSNGCQLKRQNGIRRKINEGFKDIKELNES